jgi:hypothetical protein
LGGNDLNTDMGRVRSLYEYDSIIAQYEQTMGMSFAEAEKRIQEFVAIAKRTGEAVMMPMPKSKPPYPITAKIQFDKTGRVL